MKLLDKLLNQVDWVTLAYSVVRVVAIFIIAWIILKLIRYSLRGFERRYAHRIAAQGDGAAEAKKRADTLMRLTNRLISIVFWLLVGMMILTQVGIRIGPLLASAGIVGVALGFGAQSLVKDIISGFFIITENQIRVGDVAILNGTGGVVEAINFRTTLLRDLDGVVHVFPNGSIESLANMTRDWGGYTFEIGVAYKEDIDRVIAVIERVGAELKNDPELGANMVAEMEIFGVNQLTDSAVTIKGRIKAKPGSQWATGRAFLARVKKAFDVEGIEIPFPHRTIYFGEASPPFLLRNLDPKRTKD